MTQNGKSVKPASNKNANPNKLSRSWNWLNENSRAIVAVVAIIGILGTGLYIVRTESKAAATNAVSELKGEIQDSSNLIRNEIDQNSDKIIELTTTLKSIKEDVEGIKDRFRAVPIKAANEYMLKFFLTQYRSLARAFSLAATVCNHPFRPTLTPFANFFDKKADS